MLKKYFAFLILMVQVFVLSACSTDEEIKHPLLVVSSYSTEINDVSVFLSLHSLDGIDDILQADIMIHRKDGSGPSFEVQNASLEQDDGILSFDWVDGFGNKGTAVLKPISAIKSGIAVISTSGGQAINTSEINKTSDTKNISDTENTKQQTVRLILKVDEVVNERNMMFINEYELTQTNDQVDKTSLEAKSSDANGN